MDDITGRDPTDRSTKERGRYSTPQRPRHEVPRTDVTSGSRTTTRETIRGDGPVRDEPSVGDLVKDLAHDASHLFRQEVNLARTEMTEKIAIFQKNLVSIVVGGALLLAAALLLIAALNRGLTALFTNWFGWDIAVWLAPLLIAALFGFIGFGLIGKGRSSVKDEGITPHQTIETLQDDKRWVERKVKHEQPRTQ